MTHLPHSFEAAEQLLQALLTELDDLDEAQLIFKPAPAVWSIIDVMQHLVLSEEQIHHFVAVKRDPQRTPKSQPWWTPLRMVVMELALRAPLKYKTPSASVNPRAGASYGELKARWLQTRAQHRQFLQDLPDSQRHLPIFPHPFFGWLNIGQTWRFIHQHSSRHRRQIKRLQRHSDFPAPVTEPQS